VCLRRVRDRLPAVGGLVAACVALLACLHDAASAARLEAGVVALVVVALVAVVALFARLDLAVTAGRERAGAGACVVVVGVAVVARLARLLDAVTATGGLALGRAGVVVHRVAVVALLRGSRLQRDDAVTAGRLRTQVGTVVLVVAVPVVALFTLVQFTVAAQLGNPARRRNLLVVSAGDEIHRQQRHGKPKGYRFRFKTHYFILLGSRSKRRNGGSIAAR